jgi:SAM-dependent methyltransferase
MTNTAAVDKAPCLYSGASAFDRYLKSFCESYFSAVPKDASIVGTGIGNGELESFLLEQGFTDITGVDLDDFRHPELKDRFPFKPCNLSFDSLPLDDESVDLITSIQVLEHLENPWNYISECRRVLKKGGTLLLSHPTSWDLPSRIRFLLEGDVHSFTDTNNHITFFTRATHGKLLRDFNVIEKVAFQKSYPRNGVLSKLIHRLAPANGYFCHKSLFVLSRT